MASTQLPAGTASDGSDRVQVGEADRDVLRIRLNDEINAIALSRTIREDPLANSLLRYLHEEYGHDAMLAKDLEVLGMSPEEVADSACSPIVERSVVYKYLLPQTEAADRSWRRMKRVLDLPFEYEAFLLQRKDVPEHVIESELVIYGPGTVDEAAFLIPPAEDLSYTYIRFPRSRGAVIRQRSNGCGTRTELGGGTG